MSGRCLPDLREATLADLLADAQAADEFRRTVTEPTPDPSVGRASFQSEIGGGEGFGPSAFRAPRGDTPPGDRLAAFSSEIGDEGCCDPSTSTS
jgi:hypothetical protein